MQTRIRKTIRKKTITDFCKDKLFKNFILYIYYLY